MENTYSIHYHVEGDFKPYKQRDVVTKDIHNHLKEMVKFNKNITIMEWYLVKN